MILLMDNYDSFSYNLVQLAGSMNKKIQVVRNDQITVEEIRQMSPSHLILSPGPGCPKDAGILEETVQRLKGVIPILGVCLGHQGICEALGGYIVHAKRLMHGKQSWVALNSNGNQCPLFQGLPSRVQAARYHSLSAEQESLPAELEVVARDCEDGEIMAVQHKKYPVYGLQFHPESILTPEGGRMLENFLSI